MLVLSRKVGERVVIDGGVTVVVTKVVGNRVTLGIEAPPSVHVLRGELADQRRAAAEATDSTGESASPPSPQFEPVYGTASPSSAPLWELDTSDVVAAALSGTR